MDAHGHRVTWMPANWNKSIDLDVDAMAHLEQEHRPQSPIPSGANLSAEHMQSTPPTFLHKRLSRYKGTTTLVLPGILFRVLNATKGFTVLALSPHTQMQETF